MAVPANVIQRIGILSVPRITAIEFKYIPGKVDRIRRATNSYINGILIDESVGIWAVCEATRSNGWKRCTGA